MKKPKFTHVAINGLALLVIDLVTSNLISMPTLCTLVFYQFWLKTQYKFGFWLLATILPIALYSLILCGNLYAIPLLTTSILGLISISKRLISAPTAISITALATYIVLQPICFGHLPTTITIFNRYTALKIAVNLLMLPLLTKLAGDKLDDRSRPYG